MYGTPRRATPNKKLLPEGPIADFTNIIEETPVEQWQKRTAALRELVEAIPEGSAYIAEEAWYSTATTLRHLSFSIGELLKDPRSTVVKRTCESLTRLFVRCQSDARYLFKDLMPLILSVHAQTVVVIRTAVQEMVMEAIPEVPCKMVMPMWMDRLKVDKSRTVREACALYLGQALMCWTEEGYLTPEIWFQVGTILLRSLRDPSPLVRSNAKGVLEQMQGAQPECWAKLVNDEDGPVSKDPKLQRWLKSLGRHSPDTEELSVVSKFSYNSETRYAAKSARGSPNKRFFPPEDIKTEVPTSIKIKSPQPSASSKATKEASVTQLGNKFQQIGGLGPPLRQKIGTSNVFEETTGDSPARPSQTPPRHPTTPLAKKSPRTFLHTIDDHTDSNSHAEDEIQSNPSFPTDLNEIPSRNTNGHQVNTSLEDAPGHFDDADDMELKETSSLEISPEKSEDEGPFIASMQALKKHASKRRSRNSMIMQERFRLSGHLDSTDSHEVDDAKIAVAKKRSEEENEVPNATPKSTGTPLAAAPEHMVIAIRLLRAHKAHVDAIMETLKIEMDTLRDFDKLLEEPGRPLEEEVLDYFESVGLCLDQRTQAGASLQREMDQISRGEAPQE